MALDYETGGDGKPLDEGGPEWGSVEEERDYWKALAQSYGAKLLALERTLKATWAVEQGALDPRRYYIVSYDLDKEIDTDLSKLT